MPKERRLAAIMFTDIVGYTALMGSDEDRAFEMLHKNREIHSKLIEQFNGTLIKEMGDGILTQFNSAIDSVQCAINIQKRAREELKGKIRIGIHLGDVTFENEDVFGDGVNLASRLQSITDPGGIYISESIQKAIRGKSDIQTRYLGEFKLKNVDYLVKTYSIQGDGLPVPDAAKIKKLIRRNLIERVLRSAYTYIILLLLVSVGWWSRKEFLVNKPTISSLIFLPFENYTGSDTLDYLFAGMHDALIGEAGRISAWQVKSKTTANAYKDVKKSIPEIGSETKTDAVVETSVSCFGEQVCFQVAIINAREDKQLWIKDYTVRKSAIPNLFRTLAKEISKEINVSLSPREEELLAGSIIVDTLAYDLYMRGQVYVDQMSMDALEKAARYFNLAIERDPDWAPPYRGMARVIIRQISNYEYSSIDNQKIMEYLNRALELDSDSWDAHGLSAQILAKIEWNWGKAEKEFLKSLELNPNNAEHRIAYAKFLTIHRRADEAIYHAKIAQELDPLNLFMLGYYADILTKSGECKAAITQIEKGLSIEPDNPMLWNQLSNASHCIGDYEKAFEMWKKVNYALWEEYDVTERYEKAFQEGGWLAAQQEAIQINEELYAKDGLMNIVSQGERYWVIGKYEKALDYWEKAYEVNYTYLPSISTRPVYNTMEDNPRYIALLKKMNLPVD